MWSIGTEIDYYTHVCLFTSIKPNYSLSPQRKTGWPSLNFLNGTMIKLMSYYSNTIADAIP
jgi:hypothetical protein